MRGFSSEVKLVAFTSLVRPIVEYASAAWDPFLQNQINDLEGIQQRGTRFILGDFTRGWSVSEKKEELRLSKLNVRREDHRIILFHRVLNGETIINPDDVLKKPHYISRFDHTRKVGIWQPQTD